ncbi:hypothetical protein F0562_002446 [Nyssa sinensis]|uniref:Retrotransposon Copia-like N-terminal domain-containing protein n=1 Tax=Nyssa sinensis TaxID=561372 RepID=A0A5J5C9K2_9ASTE|nr:hypothetical protein F0562_002446 [Nyssa sinensis]
MENLVSSWFNVQSLPENYVFPPDKRPGKLSVPLCKIIPVIDLGNAVDHDRSNTIQQILKASQEFGFFQVINHGVSETLMDETRCVIKEFFDMPNEEKASVYSEDPMKTCRLYTSSFAYPNEDVHFWRDNLRHPCHPLEECIQQWPEKPARYRAMAESSTPNLPSPYLLHRSDSPSLTLVNGLLTGDNYPQWQRAMTRALNAKNKLGFVDGILQRPDPTKPEYTQWNQTKDMVLTWILNSINPSLATSLEYHTDSRDVWVDLSSRFSHGNNVRIYQLKRTLSSLQQTTNSVHDYYNRMKQIWDEFGHLQQSIDLKALQQQADDEKVFQFLLGLNDSFASLRTQILAMDPLPPIGKVFSILFQKEQQRLLNIRPSETIALAVRPGGRPKSSFKCTACSKEGHTRDCCWTIVGYPPGRNPRSTNPLSILSQPPSKINQIAVAPSSLSPVPGLSPELY